MELLDLALAQGTPPYILRVEPSISVKPPGTNDTAIADEWRLAAWETDGGRLHVAEDSTASEGPARRHA